MRIFHYTSIETLALILRNRTIRFTRLDKVDDPEEYDITEDGVTPAHYCFASCWTKNQEESLPQWYMYGCGSHGVRIEMDSDMFCVKNSLNGHDYLGGLEMTNLGDCIMPVLHNQNVLQDIIYVDEMKSVKQKIFKSFVEQKGIHFIEIGVYKSNDWIFQKECRFRLFALPMKPYIAGTYYSPSEVIANNIPPKVDYIDVPLLPKSFSTMKILLGPKVSLGEKIIVESLIKEYFGRTDYEISTYTNKL